VNDVFEKIIDSHNIYSIVNTKSRFLNITKEAQKYLASEAPIVPRVKGSKVVINNLPTRLLVRFFIRFFSPKFPTKTFRNEHEALLWLRHLKEKNKGKTQKNLNPTPKI